MLGLFYRTFGMEPRADLTGFRLAAVFCLAALFVGLSLALLAVINFFSLFFGVTINFLGRDGVRFGFPKFLGAVPYVAVNLPLLFGYAVWHNGVHQGFGLILLPVVSVAVLAVLLLGGLVVVNGLLRR